MATNKSCQPAVCFGYPDDLAQYVIDEDDRSNGIMKIKPKGLVVQFSNGGGWEHVSVSRKGKTPSWSDMDWIKRKFWPDWACVIQYHVPAREHIDVHKFCLHLWRPRDAEIPRPPGWMVG
jgi:hypothetical protein